MLKDGKVTDGDTGGSPKAPAGRDKRHSPWPLVIVVALPLLSALLGLPIWVTLVLLILGTVLLAFSPHLRERRVSDPRKAWTLLMASYTRLKSAYAALKESPADAAARENFSKLEAECRSLLNSRSDSDWGKDSGYVTKVKNEIAAMSASVSANGGSPAPAPNEEIGQLADLQRQGLISEPEFQAYSERFKILSAEKACGILETMAGLRLQCTQGAMTKADYHAALWSLLDRVDHEDSGATPKPAPSA